jgi:hypothetical protein
LSPQYMPYGFRPHINAQDRQFTGLTPRATRFQ